MALDLNSDCLHEHAFTFAVCDGQLHVVHELENRSLRGEALHLV